MHLERWMVDELVDDDVRVLRAALRSESAAAASVEAHLQSEWSGGAAVAPVEAPVATNRDLVLDLEAAPTDGWTAEHQLSFDRRRLTAFLVVGAARTARPGLPAREELREGDVYYVVEPTGDGARTRVAVRDL